MKFTAEIFCLADICGDSKSLLYMVTSRNVAGIKIPNRFATRRIPVKIKFCGKEYRTSAYPNGDGHVICINLQMKTETKTNIGDILVFDVIFDKNLRSVRTPKDVKQAYQKAGVWEAFKSMSPSVRKSWVLYIRDAKTELTRKRRIAKSIAELIG